MVNVVPSTFLDLVKKSGLIESELLERVLADNEVAKFEETDELAELFVHRRLLSRWQAKKLAGGKWKGFYLGKYKLVDALYSGIHGREYLAEHTILRRSCVVKVLSRGTPKLTQLRERFFREARIAAGLQHPNIVRVYDVESVPDGVGEGVTHFLVLEYVGGISLYEFVKRHGQLPVFEAVEYIRQAAVGLAHIHDANLIHGNIKPQNLILDHAGIVKIRNLALSRFISSGAQMEDADLELGRVVGTPNYMAPEAAINSRNIDQRADIYSLGCTFYCMLSGRDPFPDGTRAQRIALHQTQMPLAINQMREDIPSSIANVLEKMMAKDPTARFQSCAEIVEELAASTATSTQHSVDGINHDDDQLLFDVFLCHNSEDKVAVKEIGKQLIQKGLYPWLDEWQLQPGLPWQRMIERDISRVAAAAVFVGDKGLGPWQIEEIEVLLTEFVRRSIPVIPVILPTANSVPNLPLFLTGRTWVDFRKSDPDPLERLVWGVTGVSARHFLDKAGVIELDYRKASSARPTPMYQNEFTREVSKRIQSLRLKKRKLLLENNDAAQLKNIESEIRRGKKHLRDGPQLQVGDCLAERYEIVERAGSGSFGTVWKAYDEMSERVVAVKVLHGQHSHSQERFGRFCRGARVMQELAHANIVRVLDSVSEDRGYLFFVMEFVNGTNFAEGIRKGTLHESVLYVVMQVAEALVYAHNKGVIHRDVSPDNILVTHNKCAKLSDFDLARLPESTGGTRTEPLGKFLYSAPEALEDAQSVDARCDVFSLGMTAVFGFAGRDLRRNDYSNGSGVVDTLDASDSLKSVLKRAVSWDPVDRYGSVDELYRELKSVS